MAIPCNNIGDKKPQMRLLEWSSLVTTQKVLCLAWNKLMNLNFRLTSSSSLRKLFFILDQLQLDVKFILDQMNEGLKNFTKLKWREIGSIAKLMQFIDYINSVCVCVFPLFLGLQLIIIYCRNFSWSDFLLQVVWTWNAYRFLQLQEITNYI